jgi:hypothetical protein
MNLGVVKVLSNVGQEDHDFLFRPGPGFGIGQSSQQNPFQSLLHLQEIVCADFFLPTPLVGMPTVETVTYRLPAFRPGSQRQ